MRYLHEMQEPQNSISLIISALDSTYRTLSGIGGVLQIAR